MCSSSDVLDEARNNSEAMLSVIFLDNPSVAKVCASWRLIKGMIPIPDKAESVESLWPDTLPDQVVQEIAKATMYQPQRAITLISQLRQHGLIFPDGTIHKAARNYLLKQAKNTLG